jgi:hypothetical protein
VLGDEHRMAPIRRLLAVVARERGGEPLPDDVRRMAPQALRPVQPGEAAVAPAEVEALPEPALAPAQRRTRLRSRNSAFAGRSPSLRIR